MYGKKIFEISENLGGEKRKFYVIPYKRRETYFQNNFRAIRFLKIKFRHYPGNPRDSRMKKKGVYFLIKLGILQPFLKKIWLSEKLGDIIFAGGQIKSFDLKKEIVTSFPVNDADKFVVLKESQKKLAKIGFAPKILEINKNFPLSREELLSEYWEGNDREVFRKLLSYYSLNKIGKISIGSYVNLLEKDLKKSNIEKHRIK